MENDTSRQARNASQYSRPRQGNSGTPRVRASCDHCSRAKIRCGQDRPSCQRCLYLDIQCNYSASRRMGRASNGKNAKSTTHRAAKKDKKTISYCSDTTSESSYSPQNNTQQLPGTGLASYGQDFDLGASQPWDPANFISDLSASPNFASFPHHQANATDLAQAQTARPQLQATQPGFDQLKFAASAQNDISPNLNGMRIGAGQSGLEEFFPELLTPANTISDQASSIAHTGTSCVDLASSTLHSLSLPSNICTSSPDPIPRHTVEQILANSRGAISAFNRILECPCSHSSSFTLTLALMISKILDCYSAICRCSMSSPTPWNQMDTISPATSSSGNSRTMPSARDLTTPTSSSNSLSTSASPTDIAAPRGPHHIVMDTPIAIGGFKIDPDDECSFILQLLLSELRKVGKLVDAFAIQCSAAVSTEGKSNCDDDSVFEPLENFLRCQVRKARREVDSLLRRNEEGA